MTIQIFCVLCCLSKKKINIKKQYWVKQVDSCNELFFTKIICITTLDTEKVMGEAWTQNI